MPDRLNRFEYDLWKFSKREGLIETGKSVLIMFSGGLDSTVLTWLLHRFQVMTSFPLQAIHFNHGVREDNDREATLAGDFCRKLGIGLEVVKLNFASKANFQNEAREKRYALSRELMKKKQIPLLALGHHLDDLVETQIGRMIRGTSLLNLCPMTPKRNDVIRPLLKVKKSALMKYALSEGLTWNDDPSNGNADYARNFIRLQIIPLMERIGGSFFAEKMSGLADDAQSLREQIGETLGDSFRRSTLEYDAVSRLPSFESREMIHRFLVFNGLRNVRREFVLTIESLVRRGRGGWRLVPQKGFVVKGKKRLLQVVAEESQNNPSA